MDRREFLKAFGVGVTVTALPIKLAFSSAMPVNPALQDVRLKGRYNKNTDVFNLDVHWKDVDINDFPSYRVVDMHTSGLKFEGGGRDSLQLCEMVTNKVNTLFRVNGFKHIQLSNKMVTESFIIAANKQKITLINIPTLLP